LKYAIESFSTFSRNFFFEFFPPINKGLAAVLRAIENAIERNAFQSHNRIIHLQRKTNYKPEGRGEGLSNDKGGRRPENSLRTKNNENGKVQ
jgi:hypothetical protein